jgi:bifunctional non-homologous end joining protein LigD
VPDILRVGGHDIEITNRDKLFFPGEGITKGELIDYYRRIADIMIPHMKGRPVTMHRFPDGIEGEGFFQQQIGDYFPDWINRISLAKEDGETTHLICDDAATLVYIANQGCVTPHVWLSRRDKIDYPDILIFDLDPPGNDFAAVRQASFYLHEILNELELKSYVKTTGSRGLHIATPLDRSADFDRVRAFAREVAKILVEKHPREVTDEQRKLKRGGRVFIDTGRNSYGQTAVAPYAVRAKPGAPVATPLEWEELEDSRINSQSYNIKNIWRRLSQKKDPWRGMWRQAHSLKNH